VLDHPVEIGVELGERLPREAEHESNDHVAKPAARTPERSSSASSTECRGLSIPAYRGSNVWIPEREPRDADLSRHAEERVAIDGARVRFERDLVGTRQDPSSRRSASSGRSDGVPPPK
jgi:hypothetical protein